MKSCMLYSDGYSDARRTTAFGREDVEHLCGKSTSTLKREAKKLAAEATRYVDLSDLADEAKLNVADGCGRSARQQVSDYMTGFRDGIMAEAKAAVKKVCNRNLSGYRRSYKRRSAKRRR